MYKTLTLVVFSLITISNAQNQISKTLIDEFTKAPLISATINNSIDYTITNDDGRFVFFSKKDSIIIKMLGYNQLKTTFEELRNTGDTIFLK